jgi:ribonuclease P protein component
VANKSRFRSLTRTSDFQQLKLKGHRFQVTPWMLVNANSTTLDLIRCGWTIPRQVGPAVIRNRFKRWGREYLRAWSKRNQLSLDVNVIFKRRDKEFYKAIRHGEFDEALEKMVGKLTRLRE